MCPENEWGPGNELEDQRFEQFPHQPWKLYFNSMEFPNHMEISAGKVQYRGCIARMTTA